MLGGKGGGVNLNNKNEGIINRVEFFGTLGKVA